MITKDEALNTIAVKRGHKDWELARYRLGDRHLHVLILEAMEYYATQSNSHKQVVSGKQPTTDEIEALAQADLEKAISGNIALWPNDSEERDYFKIVWKQGFTAALSAVACATAKGEERKE